MQQLSVVAPTDILLSLPVMISGLPSGLIKLKLQSLQIVAARSFLPGLLLLMLIVIAGYNESGVKVEKGGFAAIRKG